MNALRHIKFPLLASLWLAFASPTVFAQAASFHWKMTDRTSRSDYKAKTYDKSFISPVGWTVVLTVDSPAPPDASYLWEIKAVGNEFKIEHKTKSRIIATSEGGEPYYRSVVSVLKDLRPFSEPRFNEQRTKDRILVESVPQLPHLGKYDVTLTVLSPSGESKTTQRIHLRDYLIVSIGDSLASGQGVPDVDGTPESIGGFGFDSVPEVILGKESVSPSRNKLGFDRYPRVIDDLVRQSAPETNFPMKKKPVWQDARAYRSRKAPPALAALEIEARDPHSSVTFLSLASSGATIDHGLVNSQFSEQKMTGQLQEMADLVGDRQIDAMVISIGGNDCGFSKLLATAIEGNLIGSKVLDAAQQRIKSLPAKIQKLQKVVDTTFATPPKFVFLTEYPTALFNEKGNSQKLNSLPIVTVCGRVQRNETEQFLALGQSLNSALRKSVEGSLTWRYVGDIAKHFKNHDYCKGEGDSYYVQLDESVRRQGDILGAFHPNEKGQRIIADRIAQRVYNYTMLRDELRDYRDRTKGALTDEQRSIARAMDPVTPAETVAELIQQHRFLNKPAHEDEALQEIERRHSDETTIRFLFANSYLMDALKFDSSVFGKLGNATVAKLVEKLIKKESGPELKYRSGAIGEETSRYDIAALAEVFQDSERESLIAKWKESGQEPYSNELLDGGGLSLKNLFSRKDVLGSGLLSISRQKFNSRDHFYEYHADGNMGDIDHFCSKGVLRIEVESGVRGGNLEIYSTHLIAGDNSKVRRDQIVELVKFFKLSHRKENIAIICGDFNINAKESDGKFLRSKLAEIGFEDTWKPEYGPGHTSNPLKFGDRIARRDIASPLFAKEPLHASAPGTRIDYIFIQKPTKEHTFILDYSRPRRVTFNAPEVPKGMGYLSDHLGLSIVLYPSPKATRIR